MHGALYGGVNAAVLTPMRADLSVDHGRLAERCRWLLASGCNGIGVLGTTGEANSLGVAERMELLDRLAASGIPPARLLPGCGTPAIPDTVALVRKAAEIGCPGVLLLPPFFYKQPSDDGLFAYFSEIAERMAVDVKLYLYHFPQQSAVAFSVDLVRRLRHAFPGLFKGIKDSSGDFTQTTAFVEAFAAEGFEVYCGDDTALLRALRIGAAGGISAASNVTCGVNAQVFADQAGPAGETAQRVLTAMRGAIATAPLLPGLKSIVARHTADPGWTAIRPPHLKLTAEQEARLFTAFDACGVALAAAA